MKQKHLLSIFFYLIFSHHTFAQPGIHGSKLINSPGIIINEYTALSASVTAGSTIINVNNSTLNANNRFTGGLSAGELIMIYQVQGVDINGYLSGTIGLPNDTSWGKPLNYFNTGLYEFAEVRSVPNSTSIVIDCGLKNSYSSNSSFFRTIVVRVPRYTALTIDAGGVLTCDDWNGTFGGVLAVEVQGNTTINTGGLIDVSGRGFRGGSLVGDNMSTFGVNNHSSTDNTFGAEKGEGVTGYQSMYDIYGGRYGRGAAANAGGGGCAHNGGGGGGANASSSSLINWKGWGIPDLTGTNYTTAWNLDNAGIAISNNSNSAGGGRGGYSFSSSNQNAITTAPGSASWGGDNRNKDAAGLGGRALDYSTGRLFYGGGGGAGDQNNGGGGNGGDGGGLVYMLMYGNLSGSGIVQSNGNNGSNSQGGSGFPTGIDGAGGGGAGGVVILNALGIISNSITINTNGGTGGNQVVFPTTTNETEGPGGGGSGGYIAVSNGTPIRNSNGGNNGTTNTNALTEFLPNGATKGCSGIANATISNFTITASNVSVCVGNSAVLSVSISGTLPAGSSIIWYDAQVAGNVVGTGTSFTTGIITGATTYYVGTCPGTYKIPVLVSAYPQPTITVNSGTICSGSSFTIAPSGANSYTIQGGSAIVSPTANASYTVVGSSSLGCLSANSATSNILVNANPTVNAVSSLSLICVGQTASLTASGASTYTWNTTATTAVIAVSPTINTTYTVIGTDANGCENMAVITQSVSSCTGIESLGLRSPEFIVFPNPTSGILNITLMTSSALVTDVIITNVLGLIVLNEKITEQYSSFNIEHFSKGVYFVRVGNVVRKIIFE